MGGDTQRAMEVCGLPRWPSGPAQNFALSTTCRSICIRLTAHQLSVNFPFPPVRDADVYIGLPKWKVHLHTTFTGAMKLQFGNLPDYDWMVRCHRDDIYQKIVNLTRAANPKWFVMDSLYACQGNGPFSAVRDDLIQDFNTLCGGPDPVAVDTICEAIMDWIIRVQTYPLLCLARLKGWVRIVWARSN